MKIHTLWAMFALIFFLITFDAIYATASEVSISELSLSETGSLQAGVPITVTANAEAADGQTVYYKFFYCANYGTDDYFTTSWTVVQDYSIANSADYTFPSAGNYIIVVRAVTDPENEPAALPIVGQAVVVGDNSQVSLVGMTSNATPETEAGDTVTVTATATGPSDQSLYYEFYYCANYGSSNYATTPWTLIQEYSTSNSCQYVFPISGDYIIVVRAVTDPNNEPTALPIVGSAISIGGSTMISDPNPSFADSSWSGTLKYCYYTCQNESLAIAFNADGTWVGVTTMEFFSTVYYYELKGTYNSSGDTISGTGNSKMETDASWDSSDNITFSFNRNTDGELTGSWDDDSGAKIELISLIKQ